MTAPTNGPDRLMEWIASTRIWLVTAVATASSVALSLALCFGTYRLTGLPYGLHSPAGLVPVILPIVAPLMVAPLICLPVLRAVSHHVRLLREIQQVRAELEGEVAVRSRLQAALEEQAVRDPLTGLLNRRGFFRAAARGWEGAVVLILDIDGLKGVNDDWGHASGDVLLCSVAEVLRTTLTPGAFVARLGGDEFAAVVDAATGEGDELRELVRSGLAASRPDLPPGAPRTVSASIGSARFGPDVPIDVALAEADRRMYAEKRRAVSSRG